MLKAIDEKGEMKNLRTTETGALKVALEESSGGESGETSGKVNTTLKADILTVGTTATNVAIGKKITRLMLANYSETAQITVNIGTDINYIIGSNIACDLVINKQVENISITSSENNTNIQIVVEGEE